MEVNRRKFQGVLNILSFNRHFYVIGLITLLVILYTLHFFNVNIIWIWVILGVFAYGLLMPLIVSAYVYDFSGYYDFNWLNENQLLDINSDKIVNINAGFDETSFILEKHYPNAEIQVFDFYNQKQHTEPAIVRARKVSLTYPNTTTIESNNIPVEDNSIDLVFLLSAAHEIRSNDERTVFLKECKRILKKDGKVIC